MSTPVSPGVRSPGAGLTPLTPASMGGYRAVTPLSAMSRGGGGSAGFGSGSGVPPTPQTQQSTPKFTPGRRELGSVRRVIVPNTPMTSSDRPVYAEAIHVWGTNVSIAEARAHFKKFFNEFPGPDGQPLYPALLREVLDKGEVNLNLNAQNLHAFNPQLYQHMITYPQEILPAADMMLKELRQQIMNPDNDPQIAADIEEAKIVSTRPFNLVEKKNMRELNPEDMDALIAIKGMVIRVGGIVPDMQLAYFQCSLCAQGLEVPPEDGVINEPVQCFNCQSRHSYRLVHNRCKYADKQLLKVQETPDSIPEGETPHSIKIYAFDDLVDLVKPGDRVEITGIYKATAPRVNPRRSTLSTVYRTYVDAIHFKKTENSRLANEADLPNGASSDAMTDIPLTGYDEGDATAQQIQAMEAKIIALSQEPGIYDKLTRSLAPSIWELEDVKKGILCLLFGGSGAEMGASSGKFRGEINVLMCGDPGTSKSQLLQYVHKIAPRGIYTSGKGSSAVGLTASVVKDSETKEMVLESGALVLSDRGVCCIDEFDKMSDATRSILHEVMEQQTVSIAKAGIVCTLNARTSILASANPKESRYNPKLSVVENVQIMPTLLSRFDLIYLVLDQPNELKDRKLAKHLVGLYHEDVDRASVADTIDMETLTGYISYARRNIRPALSNEAQDKLIEFYTTMRQQGANQKTITATPRQLEALIRLSEALAKMTLSTIVTESHVYEAKRLMDVATQRAATDPTTGRIDMDLLQTGHSSTERQETTQIAEAILEVLKTEGTKSMRDRQLMEKLNNQLRERSHAHVSYDRFKDALGELVTDGTLRVDSNRMVKLV